MDKLEKIKKAIKEGTLKARIANKIRSTYTYRKGIHFITNTKVNELQSEVKVAERLRKKYSALIEKGGENNLERESSNKVWICWLQGYDAAPMFIKACINSAKRNMPDREIVILSDQNIADYIEFPQYIEEKKKKGIISMTHYSDLVRIAILVKYGGLWIDSTVLCTGSGIEFDVILNSPLFVYKQMNLTPNSLDPIACSSWLISAYKNSPILSLTQKLLYQYWKDYNSLMHYFLVHLFLSIAAQRYPKEWNQIPTFNNHSPHVMAAELGNKFSDKRWRQYLGMSSFHKLTRHIDFESISDSNYVYILNKYGAEYRDL